MANCRRSALFLAIGGVALLLAAYCAAGAASEPGSSRAAAGMQTLPPSAPAAPASSPALLHSQKQLAAAAAPLAVASPPGPSKLRIAPWRTRTNLSTAFDTSPHKAGRYWFMTYGDDAYASGVTLLAAEASRSGYFHKGLGLRRRDLSRAFVDANRPLLAQRRGGGYWSWKPDVILRALDQLAEDDVLLYADAGCALVGNPLPFRDLAAAHGLLLFTGKQPQRRRTKGGTFLAMGVNVTADGDKVQVVGGIIALQKRGWVVDFLMEWEYWMTTQAGLFVNDVDTSRSAPDDPTYLGHRHDQSILTILAYQWGVFTTPGNFYGPPADVLRVMHRGYGTAPAKMGRKQPPQK